MNTTSLHMTEKEYQGRIVEAALLMGWMVHHVIDSKEFAKRIGIGFPDLVLVHPERGKVLFVEVKAEKGRLRKEQQWWAEALARCEGVGYMLSRPSTWSELEGVLRGR